MWKPTVLLAAALAVPAQALHFFIDGAVQKCFFEELPKDTLVVGTTAASSPLYAWGESNNKQDTTTPKYGVMRPSPSYRAQTPASSLLLKRPSTTTTALSPNVVHAKASSPSAPPTRDSTAFALPLRMFRVEDGWAAASTALSSSH